MKKGLAMVLGASMVMGMAMPACAADADLVYAVEAGSAGEAAAEENGFQYNSVASQADALMEVASGTIRCSYHRPVNGWRNDRRRNKLSESGTYR